VAVRLTNNRLIASLCDRCNSALLSTSANISGQKTATSLLALTRNFHQELDECFFKFLNYVVHLIQSQHGCQWTWFVCHC
jgi:hypothetical protein